jgi:hypothetical protein
MKIIMLLLLLCLEIRASEYSQNIKICSTLETHNIRINQSTFEFDNVSYNLIKKQNFSYDQDLFEASNLIKEPASIAIGFFLKNENDQTGVFEIITAKSGTIYLIELLANDLQVLGNNKLCK